MGQCYAKSIPVSDADHTYTYTYTTTAASPNASYNSHQPPQSPHRHHGRSPRPTSKPATPSRASAAASPWLSPLPPGIAPSPARPSTPRRFFRRPFPPPSPAKHIKASLAKRAPPTPDHQVPDVAPPVSVNTNGDASFDGLDKSFGFGKNFGAKYELGKEVGRGHFGLTSIARAKKGEMKGQLVAVKIIPKSKVLKRSVLVCVGMICYFLFLSFCLFCLFPEFMISVFGIICSVMFLAYFASFLHLPDLQHFFFAFAYFIR
jgi:hypothetical protein